MAKEVVVVVGLGEVGKPLFDILSRSYECIGVDIEPVDISAPCSVLHICIPFQLKDFIGICSEYIAKYKPKYTVVNSTIAPGTTRAIAERSGAAVAYSPVRGKHAKMEADMLRYRKFVGADSPQVADAVIEHFAEAGFKTDRFRSTEIGELSKLLETTWLGVLVGWAQEAERLAEKYSASYEEVDAYIQEIEFLPHVFPGYIGGHCVMPNIAILRSVLHSEFLDAIVKSNESKASRLNMYTESARA
jgi:UDP-N-acetyl-D-mannosaminuronate dehydrogenase